MPSIKINTYKAGEVQPEVTVTVPLQIFRMAKKLVPAKAWTALEEQGIDLATLDELLERGEPLGVLLEVEDHRKGEKTVISIE